MLAGHEGALVAIGLLSFVLSFVGASVGLVLGHLRLPLLVGLLGSSATATATNAVISGAGALAGTYRHLRDGRINWLCLGVMGVPSVLGAVVGARCMVQMHETWTLLVIGLILVLTGYNLVHSSADRRPLAIPLALRYLLEVAIGFGLGMLTALTGLMLGSLRLPMMLRLLPLDLKVALGSNMAIGCLTALFAAGTSWPSGAGPNWSVLAVVVPPTMLGGYLGTLWMGRLPKQAVQRLAGWVIAGTGLIMMGQGVLPRPHGSPDAAGVSLPDGTEESTVIDADNP